MLFNTTLKISAKNAASAFLIAATLLTISSARAEVVILDKDDWKVGLSGFVEFDAISDNTSSFSEVVGNNPVKVTGYDSTVGRTQFSMRNSRFAFNIVAPEKDGMKSRGYIEMDFLGYDPAPTDLYTNTTNTGTSAANSESGFYTNPSLRIRHAYVATTNGPHQVLVGQYWSLLGWQPTYVLTTVSVAPVSGTMYERTPQITYTYTMNSSDTQQILAAVSMSRPNQRNTTVPNFEGGVKWLNTSRKAGFAGANSDIKNNPLSVAVSGASRDYTTPASAVDATQQHHTGSVVAVDTQIPLIAADGDSAAGSLSLTAEYSNGQGYGDEFPSWAGMPALSNAANSAQPNLDKGLGGYDGSGSFKLVNLDTWNMQLQYHLNSGFVTLGYGLLHSANAASLGGAYDKAESTFANYFHNCTKQIRVGVEYAQFRTHYVSGLAATDSREMLATYYRF